MLLQDKSDSLIINTAVGAASVSLLCVLYVVRISLYPWETNVFTSCRTLGAPPISSSFN